MQTKRTGFYAGSFDPITNGHLDVIKRSCTLVDELIIGIGVHHGKKALLSSDERRALVEEVTQPIAKSHNITFRTVFFDGLVVDAMRAEGSDLMIRGLRDGTDFNYEMQLAGMNETMAPHTNTVFFPSSPDVRHIAASLVRQIASMGGDVSGFVPAPVKAKLDAKFNS